MIGTFFLLILCTCLGISVCMTFNAFINRENNLWERCGGVILSILMGLLLGVTNYANIENAKHRILQDYFEGKVEIIEQVDTTRTFKFN